jgi:hypothetical protein
MSNQTKSYSDYSKAFQALDQQDQDYILGVFAKTKNDPVDSTQKISKREKLIQE